MVELFEAVVYLVQLNTHCVTQNNKKFNVSPISKCSGNPGLFNHLSIKNPSSPSLIRLFSKESNDFFFFLICHLTEQLNMSINFCIWLFRQISACFHMIFSSLYCKNEQLMSHVMLLWHFCSSVNSFFKRACLAIQAS